MKPKPNERYCSCEHKESEHSEEGCHAVDVEAFDTRTPRSHSCDCSEFEDSADT